MRSDAIEHMSKTLDAAPSIFAEPPTLEGQVSAFSEYVSPYGDKGIYMASEGFGPKYELKASEGGRYMNLTDLRMMYYLGTEYAKQKLHGMKPFWDASFCRAINGYAQGAVIRHSSGRKMVSRNNDNTTAMPEAYETTSRWATVKPTQGFKWLYQDDFYYFPLNFKPPTSTTTKTFIVPLDVAYKGVYTFPMMFFAQNQYWWEENLCKSGNVRLRISKYDDIISNPMHAENYVNVGQIVRYTLAAGMNGSVTRTRKTTNPIPLVPGRYYAYIDYENAYAGTGEDTGWGPYTRNYRLVCQIASPTVYWPKY